MDIDTFRIGFAVGVLLMGLVFFVILAIANWRVNKDIAKQLKELKEVRDEISKTIHTR